MMPPYLLADGAEADADGAVEGLGAAEVPGAGAVDVAGAGAAEVAGAAVLGAAEVGAEEVVGLPQLTSRLAKSIIPTSRKAIFFITFHSLFYLYFHV